MGIRTPNFSVQTRCDTRFHYRPIKLDAFCVAFAIPPHLVNWPRWQDSNLQEHYTQLFPLHKLLVTSNGGPWICCPEIYLKHTAHAFTVCRLSSGSMLPALHWLQLAFSTLIMCLAIAIARQNGPTLAEQAEYDSATFAVTGRCTNQLCYCSNMKSFIVICYEYLQQSYVYFHKKVSTNSTI